MKPVKQRRPPSVFTPSATLIAQDTGQLVCDLREVTRVIHDGGFTFFATEAGADRFIASRCSTYIAYEGGRAPETPMGALMEGFCKARREAMRDDKSKPAKCSLLKSDGSTAAYYELPEGATQLQDLISAKNMNAQIAAIFTACYHYSAGGGTHCDDLPEGATQLQELISAKNMNGQIATIFSACYRYGEVAHSAKLRDAKKMVFYAQAEVDRLEKYGDAK